MKRILLAKKGKRLLARLIDVLIVLVITLFIFLLFVFPSNIDNEKIEENGRQINEIYLGSGLFFVDKNGNYCAKSALKDINKLEDLYSSSYVYSGITYENESLTKTLFDYYTNKFNSYGNDYNLTVDAYKTNVLKIGTEESNILDYDVQNNSFELIDNNKANITISYFISIYSKACSNLMNNSKIKDLTNENQKIIMSAVILIIPVLLGVSFIFDLLIPFLSPCCETIGKHIYRLGVLTSDGYRYKKIWLLIRWLCYVLIELIIGVMTFGASVLISYTMFLFCKKRRCLHDFIAKSVVIEKDGSIYFSTIEEENFYIERQKSKGMM